MVALLGLALMLAGCAAPARWTAGRALIEGVTPEVPSPPDSLRASLELTALEGGRKSSVTASFSARPGRAYKLDLHGIPGVTAGGFLWLPGRWDLVVYDREEYVEGEGDRVRIGPSDLGETSVHDLFSWLWGDFFPGDSLLTALPRGLAPGPGPGADPASGSAHAGGFVYPGVEADWRIEIDPGSGLPRSATRADSAFRVEFGAWRAGAGQASPDRPVPRAARFYRGGAPVLEIKVSTLEDNPAWKRDPFSLRIPKGFRRVDRIGD